LTQGRVERRSQVAVERVNPVSGGRLVGQSGRLLLAQVGSEARAAWAAV